MANLEPVLGGDDTIRRNFSKIDELFGQLQSARDRLDDLEALDDGLKRIRGIVAADGSISKGTGFTSAKNSTGSYTVTFTTAFSDTPSVAVELSATGSALDERLTAASASAFSLAVFTNAGVAADSVFHFIAIGPR